MFKLVNILATYVKESLKSNLETPRFQIVIGSMTGCN
jgi:hypothetical protein